jgi:patatin-like phospholipase/acyl hydrolase
VSVDGSHVPATPFLFRNYKCDNKTLFNGSNEFEIWKAARATSAAPLFFDPFIEEEGIFLDGGMGGNNPSIIGYLEAKALFGQVDSLFSIGTGFLSPKSTLGIKLKKFQYQRQDDDNSGSWLSKMTSSAINITIETSTVLSMMNMMVELTTNTSTVDMILNNMLPKEVHYDRFNPSIDGVDLDETDASKLLKMRIETLNYIAKYKMPDLIRICNQVGKMSIKFE